MEINNVEAVVFENKVVYTRLFDAPIELVYEAWSQVEHLEQWWGPDGFTVTTEQFEFVEGGRWTFTMHGSDGEDFPNRIQFLEIDPGRLIRFRTDGETDNAGYVEFTTTVTFEAIDGGTWLKMEQVLPTAEDLERVDREYHAIEGGKQHLGNLAKYLETRRG